MSTNAHALGFQARAPNPIAQPPQSGQLVPIDLSYGHGWIKPAKEIHEACHIPGCNRSFQNTRNCPEGLILFGLPQDMNLCEEWMKVISDTPIFRMDLLEEFMFTLRKVRICSFHFDPIDIQKNVDESSLTGGMKYRLTDEAIPNRNLPTFAKRFYPQVPSQSGVSLNVNTSETEVQHRPCLPSSPPLSQDSKVRDSSSASISVSQEKIQEESEIEVITISDSEDEGVIPPSISSGVPELKNNRREAAWLAEKRIRDWVEQSDMNEEESPISSTVGVGNEQQEPSVAVADDPLPTLSVVEKYFIIQAIQEAKLELSDHFKVSLSQIEEILENQDSIMSEAEGMVLLGMIDTD